MAGTIEIDVWQGEIAELEVDALVVGANESLFMTAGPAASVRRHGGEVIERAAVAQGPLRPGEAVATEAGDLAAAYVIHAVGVSHDRIANRERLIAAIRSALAFAEPLQLRRIAFALIGTEHGVFSAADAAEILLDELTPESGAAPSMPESIVVATANASETNAAGEALARRRARVT